MGRCLRSGRDRWVADRRANTVREVWGGRRTVLRVVRRELGSAAAPFMLGHRAGRRFLIGWRIRNIQAKREREDAPAKPRRLTRREERAIHEQHEEIVKESWQEAADAIMGLNPDN